jgi:hypothetical protein
VKAPVLVQMELVGPASPQLDAGRLARLAELEQAGRPLVLIAERPARWTPTRSQVDRAFGLQAEIEAELRRAGGVLDAVMYLDLGLFSRKRQIERTLADLANRYGVALEDMHAVAGPGRLADALREVVGEVSLVEDDEALVDALRRAMA